MITESNPQEIGLERPENKNEAAERKAAAVWSFLDEAVGKFEQGLSEDEVRLIQNLYRMNILAK